MSIADGGAQVEGLRPGPGHRLGSHHRSPGQRFDRGRRSEGHECDLHRGGRCSQRDVGAEATVQSRVAAPGVDLSGGLGRRGVVVDRVGVPVDGPGVAPTRYCRKSVHPPVGSQGQTQSPSSVPMTSPSPPSSEGSKRKRYVPRTSHPTRLRSSASTTRPEKHPSVNPGASQRWHSSWTGPRWVPALVSPRT